MNHFVRASELYDARTHQGTPFLLACDLTRPVFEVRTGP